MPLNHGSTTSRAALRRSLCLALAGAWLPAGLVRAANDDLAVLRLNSGLVISVPRDWEALSGGQRMSLYSDPHTTFDDVGMRTFEQDDGFVANHYVDRDRYDASIVVRYQPDSSYTQAQSAEAGSDDVLALDQQLHRALIDASRASSFKLVQWGGTVKRNISGLTLFVSDYVRGPLADGSNVDVRFVQVFNREYSFTIELSCRDDVQARMRGLTERIIGSIRIDRPQ